MIKIAEEKQEKKEDELEPDSAGSSSKGEEKAKEAGKKVKEKAKNTAKKILKNKKVMAFIIAHFIPILIVVLVIIKIIGLIGQYVFLTTMPGLVLEKLKEFGLGVWAHFTGFFTGDPVEAGVSADDVVSLAQFLENQGYDIESCGLGKVEYEDSDTPGSVKTIKKIGKSVDGKEYLKAYIAANEATYVLSNYSLNGFLSEVGSLFVAFVEADPDEIKSNRETSTGMINILNTQFYRDDRFVKINRKNEKMIVYTDAIYLPILDFFNVNDGKIQWGSTFSYDLSTWTARYGKPQELLLAIHLSTMMPDLAYRIAKDQDFNTKVNVVLQDVNLKYDTTIKSVGGQESNITPEQIIDAFLDYGLINGDNEYQVEVEKPAATTTTTTTSTTTSTPATSSISTDYKIAQNNHTVTSRRPVPPEELIDDGGSASAGDSGDTSSTTAVEYETKTYKVTEDLWTKSKEGLTHEQRLELFDKIMGQISNGFTKKFAEFWGINYYKLLPNKDSLTDLIKGAFGDTLLGRIILNDEYYIYVKHGSELVPGLGISYDALFELAEIVGRGRGDGIDNVKWPYIESVTNHWFYEDIDFSRGVYRKASSAKKKILYTTESEESALNKENIQVELDATLTAEEGVVYQVCEPEAYGPNRKIIGVFSDKYYKYDGTAETAKQIENSKSIEGMGYTIDDIIRMQDEGTYDDFLKMYGKDAETPVAVKYNVSFEKGKTNALAAFQMLENMHSEEADFIYRNLKDLVVSLQYFSKEELTTNLKTAMQWIIKTDNKNETFTIDKDLEEFGMIIKNVGGREVVAPENCEVSVEDGVATLKFTEMSDETDELLKFIFEKDYKKIDKNILVGMTMKIKGLNLSTSGKVSRGTVIGTASGDLTVKMLDVDQSLVEDLEEYLVPKYNSKYEQIMRDKKDGDYQEGIDIGRAFDW